MKAVWGARGRRSTVRMAVAERGFAVPGGCVARPNGVTAWCGNVGPGTGVPVAHRFRRHPDSSRQGLRASKRTKNPALLATEGRGGGSKNRGPPAIRPEGLVWNLEVLKPPGGPGRPDPSAVRSTETAGPRRRDPQPESSAVLWLHSPAGGNRWPPATGSPAQGRRRRCSRA